jgi:hypothetical protein
MLFRLLRKESIFVVFLFQTHKLAEVSGFLWGRRFRLVIAAYFYI